VTGLLLGVFFFGGLWWTIRKGLSSKHPAVLFFGSLFLRTGLVLGGFRLVSGAKWEPLLISLLGFLTARWIVKYFIETTERQVCTEKEYGHAPQSR
jgi:F1F0 ATPase subunit 2